ncbi:glucoamylase family protein [Segetibacter koreensis]|uniref:glucoamylase family protein n=1 Tax=Segetibacter koreensis TaxID=398037 RepID=UPI00037A2061|nr:glucoamylase family protein [Segetibacter koreensis]
MFKNLLLPFLLTTVVQVFSQEKFYDNVLFLNSRMDGNYFYSKASYTSPSSIKNIDNKLPVSEDTFFTPGNSLQLDFVNGKNGSWSAKIDKPEWRGQDKLKEGEILSFAVNVSSATDISNLPAIQIGLADSTISQPLPVSRYFVIIQHGKWTKVLIPLKDFAGIKLKNSDDVKAVIFSQNSTDGNEHVMYVDDIEIRPSVLPALRSDRASISLANGYAKHVDIEWKPVTDTSVRFIKIYRSVDGKNFHPVGVQIPSSSRFADFTRETGKIFYYRISLLGYDDRESSASPVVSAKTRAMTEQELLTMVQEACFRYYWEGAEENSGLAKEDIPGRHNMIAMGASGFGIMALIAGTERKFITRDESTDRFLKIANFLERTETFHGAFSHFVDGPTGKVVPFFGSKDNGGDLVETSFLMQGLIAARAYFNKNNTKEKEIRDKITGIWNNVEWSWYRKEPETKFLTWHWSPDQGWILNHQLIGWNETMVTYLLAIASPTHPVPASLYYTGWANRDSTGQQYRKNWGQTDQGSMYTNGNSYYGIKLDVGVSNGGPLFFTHYSYLGFDPHYLTDVYTNYFKNNRNIALINHRYCIENPGHYIGYSDSCWGLTASDGPYHYVANEPILRADNGKIAPTGAISSFPYTPKQSMKALSNYYYNYGHFLWGEYGFRDAFNLSENWCSEIFMGLNQAPMVVMIENYRTGLLWKLFMSDPQIKKVANKIRHKQ